MISDTERYDLVTEKGQLIFMLGGLAEGFMEKAALRWILKKSTVLTCGKHSMGKVMEAGKQVYLSRVIWFSW